MNPRSPIAAVIAMLFLGAAGAVLAQSQPPQSQPPQSQPAAAPPAAGDGLPDGPGKDVVVRVCTSCHEASTFAGRARTPQDWEFVIGRMIDGGAELTGDEQDAVYAYLVKNFGKAADAPPADARPSDPKAPPGR